MWEGVREARQPYLNGTIGKCLRLSAERFCFSEERVIITAIDLECENKGSADDKDLRHCAESILQAVR